MKTPRWQLPYESRTHSQHGEDGIIKVMTDAIVNPNRFVFEIGWGSGKENMSRALIDQGWSGIGIDCEHDVHPELVLPDRFQFRKMYVDPDRIGDAFEGVPFDLDFFSLDIDSFDFEVAAWALQNGYRPKTVCLEFNHRFGSTVQASFPWAPMYPGRPKRVYNKSFFHGVSLSKYQALWSQFGYQFFTIDSSKVNVFFFDPDQVNIDPNLPRLANADLGNHDDTVLPVVLANEYWSTRHSEIYQTVTLAAPTGACASNIDQIPDLDGSNGIEPTASTIDLDQT